MRRLWGLGRAVASAYGRNLGPQLASAIAYRALFSLFPLAIFLASIFGLLIENEQRRNDLVTWTEDTLLLSQDAGARLDEAVAGIGSAVGLQALGATAGDVAQAAVSLALLFATVLLLYRYVPPVRPRFSALWMPALLVAIALLVTQFGYGIYLSRFADYNLVYGSLAAVIGFLFLVYLCAAVFLFGAQLAAVWKGEASTGARPR